MSIIIRDLDEPIITFMDLPQMVNLMRVNKNYYEKIKHQKLILEWNEMKLIKNSINCIFQRSCVKGYINYAKSLITRYDKIDIHADNEYAFRLACQYGHLSVARWLVDLHEYGYGKIDIHIIGELAFQFACQNGHLDVAKWLIGLHDCGYGKINQELVNQYIKN